MKHNGPYKNRCNTCQLLAVTTCPLLEGAFKWHRLEGMEFCEMADAIDRMVDIQTAKPNKWGAA